jgi:hypothetical protein
MGLPEASLFVTVLVFIGGLVFHAGKLTARVDALEEWEHEARVDIKDVLTTVARIEGLLKRGSD